jgi:ATP-dependent DNA helicase RecG
MPLTLSTEISTAFRITPIQKVALGKLGIRTVEDLMRHFPVRYGDTAETKSIDLVTKGENAVIFGKVGGLRTSKGFKSHIAMADGYVEDETGRIRCVWFNQPYVAKMFQDDMFVRIEGKVSEKKSDKSLYLSNPKIEKVDKLPTTVGHSLFGDQSTAHTLYPVYPESRGITSLWIYHTIQKIFKSGVLDEIPETIPPAILEKYNLPGIRTSFIWIHAPLNRDHALSARKRFSFEEIFTIQIGRIQDKRTYASLPNYKIEATEHHVHEFVRRFPFTATDDQNAAIQTIVSDFQKGSAMSRLLEGDVGSGKTAVAAATAYAVITSRIPVMKTATRVGSKSGSESHTETRPAGLQVAYMCPTEILATQHFESFIQYFSYLGVQIALITGSGCRKFPSKVNPKGWTDISRSQLLKWVANGEIHILIGTHALIQKTVTFKNLAYVIIDEQHRFGMAQRARLAKKNADSKRAPHLLSMTATPIPRTLTLTMYGDLDLTLLDQSPTGRKSIITRLVLPAERPSVYEEVRRELQAGRQLYVICPRIDEPDPDKEAAIIAKSVKEEAIRLKKSVFPEYEIGILHSKMSTKEKDLAMNAFKANVTQILCATSVVEVGVNVPNATVIIIEGAERFGLAQLHQLRGRVQRSSHQSYCYAFTETQSAKSIERLRSLQSAKNGFELAELDLKLRGSGELSGSRQWGVSDVAMEALSNTKMVEAARTEAENIVDHPESLDQFPALKEKVEVTRKEAHFE